MCDLYLGSHSSPLVSVAVSISVAPQYNLKPGMVIPPTVLLLFTMVLATLIFCVPRNNLRSLHPISVKNCVGIVIAMALNV